MCSVTLERKLLTWPRQYIEKLITLNKHRKSFHSYFEKLPLVSMSASRFFGINIYDLVLVIQIDCVEQPVKSNSVGSAHMSHRRTSSFNYHLDHGFVVFNSVQSRFIVRRMCVGGRITHFTELLNSLLVTFWVMALELRVVSVSCMLVCLGWTLLLVERRTSITMSQRSRASNPSIRKPASREMTPDSVELCETAVC